jgi:orotidine 5'-phosphate decarboxylase subfamily 1
MKDYAIILAADLPSSEEVFSVVKKVRSIVDGVKLAAATLVESGAEIIRRTRDIIGDKPLLVDLKIADIGFFSQSGWEGTNAKIIHALEGSGATHVTVHGFPGPISVAEAVGVTRDIGMDILLLPLMSHAGAGLFFSAPVEASRLIEETSRTGLKVTFPRETRCATVMEAILNLGEALDVFGYIGPATRPADLRRYRDLTQRPIWCPGFGRQDRLGRDLLQQFSEWARVVGPASAAIVGSAIFKAPDPVAAASEIVELRDRAIHRQD